MAIGRGFVLFLEVYLSLTCFKAHLPQRALISLSTSDETMHLDRLKLLYLSIKIRKNRCHLKSGFNRLENILVTVHVGRIDKSWTVNDYPLVIPLPYYS